MTEFQIALLVNILVMTTLFIGSKKAGKAERSRKARENVQNRYRLGNGKFSSFKTYSDLFKEAKMATI